MTTLAPSPSDRRRLRYRRRNVVRRIGGALAAQAGSWDHLPKGVARVCKCGFVNRADELEVRVTHGDDGPNAYVTGLVTCGSVWVCPTCSAKIRTRRQLEVSSIAQQHADAGGTLGMMTLTVRHDSGHGLAQLMDAQAGAWRSLMQSERWRSDVRPFLDGTVRSWEVTHGFLRSASGSWHPHFHVLLLWKADAPPVDLEWIADAWRSRVERRLGTTTGSQGFDYRPVSSDAAEYVAKIGAEMTRADLKGGAQIWQLIDAVEDGETWASHRLLEYIAATHGRRAIQMSRGLRARFGLDDLTDEQIAELEVDGELVETMHPQRWRRLCKYEYRMAPGCVYYLEAVENRERIRERAPTRSG